MYTHFNDNSVNDINKYNDLYTVICQVETIVYEV